MHYQSLHVIHHTTDFAHKIYHFSDVFLILLHSEFEVRETVQCVN